MIYQFFSSGKCLLSDTTYNSSKIEFLDFIFVCDELVQYRLHSDWFGKQSILAIMVGTYYILASMYGTDYILAGMDGIYHSIGYEQNILYYTCFYVRHRLYSSH